MNNTQKDEPKIETIRRDSRGMFVAGNVKKSYSIEALSKGLDRVKNHQSVDSLNLVDLFDSSIESISLSVSNNEIETISKDVMIPKTTEPNEQQSIPQIESILSLASEPKSEERLSAREMRRKRSVSTQQSELGSGENKYKSTESSISTPMSISSSSLPPTAPASMSNRVSDTKLKSNDAITNIKDVSKKLSQYSENKSSEFAITMDTQSVKSTRSNREKPPLAKESSLSRSNSFRSNYSNPIISLDDIDEKTNAGRPILPVQSVIESTKMQIQDTTQPPPEIEKNVQISSKVSNETENEKHQSMNRLNIPDPLKIAVSNVENLSRSNSTDLDSRKKKKSSSKSVSSSKEIHDSPANQIETKHEREISKRSKTRSVDRKNSRKQKSLQETDIKSTSQNLSPSELRKMERKLSAVTDEQLLSENELKAIKKEKKRKKKSKEQQKTKEKIDDIPKESPTSPKDDLEVNNTDPTAKLYDSLGHPPEYFRNSTIKVHIHKSDTLKSNIYLKHPIVKVHFVDISTGMYLEKSDQMRQVTYFYEPESINFVLPTITNPFDLHANHTKNAKWDQKILLNESYLHILQPNVIVFFEVLDFLTNYSQILSKDSWHRVAWAFLKPIASSGKANTEKEARLQLYKYPSYLRPYKDANSPFVYDCWKETWKRYPSTIYVTISSNGIIKKPPPPKVYFTIEPDVNQEAKAKSQIDLRTSLSTRHIPVWNRKLDDPCSLPNKLMYRIETGTNGSFSCKFSNNGIYISIGCCNQNGYPIKIYQFETGDRIATLDGHQDLVYQQEWSNDDSELLSCSSDGTARVWGFMSDGSVMLTNTLVHPCFVYTAAIHPKNSGIIATGGYDGYIRLWLHQKGFKTITTKPMFKLHGHETHVNALCFNKEGNRLYTGDGNGNVRIWASVDQDHNLSYECIKTVDTLKGVSIQSLQLHVSNRKLLVQTHGSSLHMLDTRIHRYLTHYTLPDSPWPSDSTVTDFHLQMAQVPGQFTKCSFSACGTFVFSSNSTGQVYVWMCDSGSFVNTYSIDTIPSWIHSLAIVDISFHPFDNSIAFSVWGDKQPFLIYRHSDNGPDLKRDGKHVNARHLDVEKIVTKSMNLLHLAK